MPSALTNRKSYICQQPNVNILQEFLSEKKSQEFFVYCLLNRALDVNLFLMSDFFIVNLFLIGFFFLQYKVGRMARLVFNKVHICILKRPQNIMKSSPYF